MFVYFARPIDQAATSVAMSSRILDDLTASIQHKLQLAKVGSYLPHQAYLANTAYPEQCKFIEEMNQMALFRADAVLAILPAGVPTLGVPVEIERAVQMNKPTVVFTDLLGSVQVAAWRDAGAIVIDINDLDFKLPESDDLHTMLQIRPDESQPPITNDVDALLVAGKAANAHPGQYAGDAGIDLALAHDETLRPGEYRMLSTGVRLAIPHGYFGLVVGRSSTWARYRCDVRQSVIDSGYRGEQMVGVENRSDSVMTFEAGTRLSQVILLPTWTGDVVEVEELPEHERGQNGYGSSGQ